jgi:hypothetical protein
MKAAIPLGFIVLMLMAFALSRATPPIRDERPVLDVSAAKGATGISLTNREADTITDCTIVILERGRDDEWFLRVPRIKPMDTVRLSWVAFTAKGAPMPAYVGQSARYATVNCQSHTQTRRGAGLSF